MSTQTNIFPGKLPQGAQYTCNEQRWNIDLTNSTLNSVPGASCSLTLAERVQSSMFTFTIEPQNGVQLSIRQIASKLNTATDHLDFHETNWADSQQRLVSFLASYAALVPRSTQAHQLRALVGSMRFPITHTSVFDCVAFDQPDSAGTSNKHCLMVEDIPNMRLSRTWARDQATGTWGIHQWSLGYQASGDAGAEISVTKSGLRRLSAEGSWGGILSELKNADRRGEGLELPGYTASELEPWPPRGTPGGSLLSVKQENLVGLKRLTYGFPTSALQRLSSAHEDDSYITIHPISVQQSWEDNDWVPSGWEMEQPIVATGQEMQAAQSMQHGDHTLGRTGRTTDYSDSDSSDS